MTEPRDESAGFLAVRHEPEGSLDVGELLIEARANGFAGMSSAYFNDSAVLAFASRLAEYPLTEVAAPTISSGHSDSMGGRYEEHVGITVVPVGPLGQLGVRVHLAEVWPAQPAAQADVRLELLTTYERMR